MSEKNCKEPFFKVSKVASATECTGLMPTLPENEEEDENCAALYATHNAPCEEEKKG